MSKDFEEMLDEVISRWSADTGWYKWENIFRDEFDEKDKHQVLNKLCSDGLLDSGAGVYFLNAAGHDIKRNIMTKGYVAQKRCVLGKETEDGILNLNRQNLFWTKMSAYVFFLMLIVMITVTIIIFNKN